MALEMMISPVVAPGRLKVIPEKSLVFLSMREDGKGGGIVGLAVGGVIPTCYGGVIFVSRLEKLVYHATLPPHGFHETRDAIL